MDHLLISPSVWVFLGDVDEVSSVVASTTTAVRLPSGSRHSRRELLESPFATPSSNLPSASQAATISVDCKNPEVSTVVESTKVNGLPLPQRLPRREILQSPFGAAPSSDVPSTSRVRTMPADCNPEASAVVMESTKPNGLPPPHRLSRRELLQSPFGAPSSDAPSSSRARTMMSADCNPEESVVESMKPNGLPPTPRRSRRELLQSPFGAPSSDTPSAGVVVESAKAGGLPPSHRLSRRELLQSPFGTSSSSSDVPSVHSARTIPADCNPDSSVTVESAKANGLPPPHRRSRRELLQSPFGAPSTDVPSASRDESVAVESSKAGGLPPPHRLSRRVLQDSPFGTPSSDVPSVSNNRTISGGSNPEESVVVESSKAGGLPPPHRRSCRALLQSPLSNPSSDIFSSVRSARTIAGDGNPDTSLEVESTKAGGLPPPHNRSRRALMESPFGTPSCDVPLVSQARSLSVRFVSVAESTKTEGLSVSRHSLQAPLEGTAASAPPPSDVSPLISRARTVSADSNSWIHSEGVNGSVKVNELVLKSVAKGQGTNEPLVDAASEVSSVTSACGLNPLDETANSGSDNTATVKKPQGPLVASLKANFVTGELSAKATIEKNGTPASTAPPPAPKRASDMTSPVPRAPKVTMSKPPLHDAAKSDRSSSKSPVPTVKHTPTDKQRNGKVPPGILRESSFRKGSPRCSRRVSIDCLPPSPPKNKTDPLSLKNKNKAEPSSPDKAPSSPRRASVDSTSWLTTTNTPIKSKKNDPNKEYRLCSSISDLKTKLTSSGGSKSNPGGIKLDPNMFHSSVAELKGCFTKDDEQDEEEPEFNLLDSPTRKKSGKILDAISLLSSSSNDRAAAIPKIDALDEMMNSSRTSMGSFGKCASEPDNDKQQQSNELSLSNVFENENDNHDDDDDDKMMKEPEEGGDESETEDSSEVEEEEEETDPRVLARRRKEERRRQARAMWQSERSMSASTATFDVSATGST